ncbi:unnamed protein product [Heterobilharzia americana]|nr:unnamed protein product [Heterobilharzia americana]CAH8634494.1 unnamed protein product [Heterobilharzia americana]
MLNNHRYICFTLLFFTLVITSNYIVVMQSTEIQKNCKSCRKTTRWKNGFLNTVARECLQDKCIESNQTKSPWVNTTKCCDKKDLCNDSTRITFDRFNSQLIITVLSISTVSWIWFK